MKTYLQRKGDVFDAFEDFFKPVFYDEHFDAMKTDIRETKDGYRLDIELPGFKKEEIKLSLESGYLTVSAERSAEEKQEGERYLRKECSVSCQRSYYVGEDVEESGVKARCENGVLRIDIPKTVPKKIAARTIAIE